MIQQLLRLFYQAGVKHTQDSFVDTPIKFRSIGIEADSLDFKASQRLPAGLPLFAHWLFRGEANLDGTNHLGDVIGVNSRGAPAIHSLQQAV